MTIASDLDVFERVGRGVAHDEYIEFDVKDGKILYEGEESEISAGKIRVEFIKVVFLCQIILMHSWRRFFFFQSYRDNPKVNAIIVIKGAINGKNFGLQKYILSETRITRENNLTHCQLVSLFGGCFHEKMHFFAI